MTPNETTKIFHSGYVALIGRPNVGKSTLLNTLMKHNLAAVSPRPQTTRRNQLGILTLPNSQIIFVDTPGLHKASHKLGERMNASAVEALKDADLLLAVFDLSTPPKDDDERVAKLVSSLKNPPPILVALNKVDNVPPERIQYRKAIFASLIPDAKTISLSALKGTNCDSLLECITSLLPSGPRYYSEETLTNTYERDIAADMIQSAAMNLLKQEVPYCIAVRIDNYKERGTHGAYIEATIFVERESQKGIVIGKNGKMLRQIGTMARKQIEAMSSRSIYLDLRVKVFQSWRNDEHFLKRLGYPDLKH
jgi:GTP-binding protein Era